MIQQGDVYWGDFGKPQGRALGYRRPYVVVQGNGYNRSRISTVIVCGVTSKVDKAAWPGNVRLKAGEANLNKESVVSVTQIQTVDREFLTQKIGTLQPARVEEILRGIKLVLDAE